MDPGHGKHGRRAMLARLRQLGDPRFLSFVDNDLGTAFVVPVLIILVLIIFALWIGWLVAYADRKAGPVRLFLNGLLLQP